MFKKIRDKADVSPILKYHFSLQLYNAFSLDQFFAKGILSIFLKVLRYLFFENFMNLHEILRHVSPLHVTTLLFTITNWR